MRLAVADLDPITAGAGPALDYLSQAARSLAVPDPVQDHFGPVVGQWRDLHAQAELWRLAAGQVEEISEKLTIPLGGLDTVWDGRGSDAFVQHMQAIGTAGRNASDVMAALGEILDRAADGVHRLMAEFVELLCDGADLVSSAMILPVGGDAHASRHLAEIYRHSRQVFDAIRELLEAFAAACADLAAGPPFAAVRMATFPPHARSRQPDLPPAPAPSAEPPHEPLTGSPPAEPLLPGSPPAGPLQTWLLLTETPPAGPLLVEPPQGATAASELAGGEATAGDDSEGSTGGDSAPGTRGTPTRGGEVPADSGTAGGGVPAGGDADAVAGPAEPGLRTLATESPAGGQPTAATVGAGGPAAESGSSMGTRGGFAGGFLPMAGFGAGMGGQDIDRKNRSRLAADPTEVFGQPIKTAPPVIGEDDD
jgi:hypothetical protein